MLNKDNKEKYRNGENQLEGRNAILEAFHAEIELEKLYIIKDKEGTLFKIADIARQRGVVLQEVDRKKLDSMSTTKNHQGVIATLPEHAYADVDTILRRAHAKREDPFILLLDGITDPHNLGAILRTAECAGVHGVILPKRRSVGLTATVGRTSAGAISHIPVAKVTNIANTIDALKKIGIWVACADMGGDEYFESSLKGPLALVIGGEGDGVSRLVKEKCDFKISIPMYGKISSLNASVAAGLIMYEVVRQRNYVAAEVELEEGEGVEGDAQNPQDVGVPPVPPVPSMKNIPGMTVPTEKNKR